MIGNLQQSKVYYQEKTRGDKTYIVFATSTNWKEKNPVINPVNHIMDADLFIGQEMKNIKGWEIANFNQFYETKLGQYKKFKENLW